MASLNSTWVCVNSTLLILRRGFWSVFDDCQIQERLVMCRSTFSVHAFLQTVFSFNMFLGHPKSLDIVQGFVFASFLPVIQLSFYSVDSLLVFPSFYFIPFFFFNWMRMCYLKLKFNATVSSIRVCQCDRSVFYLRYDLCGRTVHFWLLWSLTLFFLLTWFMAAGLTLAPLLVKVDPNLNVILTACLTVYVGCYRSVKPTPPSVSTAGIDAPQPFLPFVPF